MDYKTIDLSKIDLIDNTDQLGKIYITYDKEPLKIITPILVSPFGMQNFNNKFYISFEVKKNIIDDNEDFFNFLNELNQICENKIKKDFPDYQFYNSLKTNDKYNSTLLKVRIPSNKQIILTKVSDKDGKSMVPYYLTKQVKCKSIINIDRIWLFNKGAGISFNLNETQIY
jgi:hypothetical protein